MFDTDDAKKKDYKILDEFISKPTIIIGIPVKEFKESLLFYSESLGCRVLKEEEKLVEVDFFGYKITLRLCEKALKADYSGGVGVMKSSDFYFGLTVGWADWHHAVSHLTYVGTEFKVRPTVELNKSAKEEAVFVLEDPSGNDLRFVAYRPNDPLDEKN